MSTGFAFEPGQTELRPQAIQVQPPRLPLMVVPTEAARGGSAAKRAIDLSVALLAVVALSPVLLALALAVLATSRGPVLFKQVRVGRAGRPIMVYKFRSMAKDAEDRLTSLLDLNESSGPLFKISDDPRVTPVGRWMRRLSLDELPQLFNVIGGSMSLVGPRPALPLEVAQYDSDELRRLWTKPGMTGLWQVSGRSDLDWSDGIRLDLQYVESQTIWADLAILVRTAPAVLRGRGAY